MYFCVIYLHHVTIKSGTSNKQVRRWVRAVSPLLPQDSQVIYQLGKSVYSTYSDPGENSQALSKCEKKKKKKRAAREASPHQTARWSCDSSPAPLAESQGEFACSVGPFRCMLWIQVVNNVLWALGYDVGRLDPEKHHFEICT